MKTDRTYVGIHNDEYGGMTATGIIIRDAWVFNLVPESETCAGWTYDRMQALYDQVSRAWGPYGHLVSNLPDDLRLRHQRIYGEAIARAKGLGWTPEVSEDE